MDKAQGLSSSVQKVELKTSVIKVVENGLEVNTGTKYCYKTISNNYIVGSDLCRMCVIDDDNKKFFDKVEEAVDYLLL